MAGVVLALTFAAAIMSALVAGIFFAFSNFVMAALARIPPEQGMAAMREINITVINPLFMTAFLGTGALCVALVTGVTLRWTENAGALIVAASVVYVAGVIGVTIALNVPLNDALAAVSPGTPEAAALWTRYLSEWTFWNHARTVAALAASALFIAALVRSG